MSFWQTHQLTIDPDNFRGHEQYLGGGGPWVEMLAHVRSIRPEWLARTGEDGSFGVQTAEVDGLTLSRDLLDSIVELDFLQRHLPLEVFTCGRWLDIGAGYGRIAHRMSQVAPFTLVTCTDAIAVSREVCTRYLSSRGVSFVATSPNAIYGQYDLALNIHSWPECTREEIRGWLDKLDALKVPRLFVVPHLDRDMLCNDDGKSFRPDIEDHGWRLSQHEYAPPCWPRDFTLWERSV